MASIVDGDGVQATPEGDLVLTKEQLSRTRDLILIRLRRMRVSFRDIGVILNSPEDKVNRRFYRIPADVRDHYGSIELG